MREARLQDALEAVRRTRTEAEARPAVQALLDGMTDAELDALAEALAGTARKWPRVGRLLAMVRGERRLAAMTVEGGVQ